MGTRYRAFVGSSSESLTIARAVSRNLSGRGIEPDRWDLGATFRPQESILGGLINASADVDAAIFVFGPDDVAVIRNIEKMVVRDNVLFEYGLFMGKLGRGRSFIIAPKSSDIHIATDLLGIIYQTYDPEFAKRDPANALSAACDAIVDAIEAARPHVCSSVVNRCRVSLEAGDLLDFHVGDAVGIYPANVFFDTTGAEDIVDRKKSTLGQYLQRRVRPDNIAKFDKVIDAEIRKGIGLKTDSDQVALEKPGRSAPFQPGSIIHVKWNLDDVVLFAVTRVNKRLRSVADVPLLFDAFCQLWRRLGDLPCSRFVMPLVGAGFGRLDPAQALSLLLLTLKNTSLSNPARICEGIQIVLYAKDGRLPGWARILFEGLFAEEMAGI